MRGMHTIPAARVDQIIRRIDKDESYDISQVGREGEEEKEEAEEGERVREREGVWKNQRRCTPVLSPAPASCL